MVYSDSRPLGQILTSHHIDQPPFPFTLGAEFAGRISANSPIPAGCPFKRGDRIFGAGQGSYAEKVAANWNSLLPVPKGLSYAQASGLFVTWPTSYEALTGRANLKAGKQIPIDRHYILILT